MPTYIYKCSTCETTRTVTHSMMDDRNVACDCGTTMHRVPQVISVNWNGPPPHIGKHPIVEQLNATYDERRDAFAKKKEEHVRRTEGENSPDG